MFKQSFENKKIADYLRKNGMDSFFGVENGNRIKICIPYPAFADENVLSEVLYEAICLCRENDGMPIDEDKGYAPVEDIDFECEEYQKLKKMFSAKKHTIENEEINTVTDFTDCFLIGDNVNTGTEMIRRNNGKITYYAYTREIYYNPTYKDGCYWHSVMFGNDEVIYPDILIVGNRVCYLEVPKYSENIEVISDCDISGKSCLILPNNAEIIGYDVAAETRLNNADQLIFKKNIRKIGPLAFAGVLELKSIEIGSQMEFISFGAFAYCKNLTEINLPSHLNYSRDYLLGIGEPPANYVEDSDFIEDIETIQEEDYWANLGEEYGE